jgi:hypothetical protein
MTGISAGGLTPTLCESDCGLDYFHDPDDQFPRFGCFIVILEGRRKIVHLNGTEHSSLKNVLKVGAGRVLRRIRFRKDGRIRRMEN